MKKSIIGLLALVFFMFFAHTQTKTTFVENRPAFIGLSLDYGFIIKHAASLREIDDTFPSGISLDWGKILITEDAWNFCNCFPKLGITASFWNWDNPDILGYGFKAIGYAETYFRTQKRLNTFFKVGIGGAYLTNPFDELNNPLNQSYSTNLSFALLFGLGINYRIDNKLNLKFGANYNHISNGGVREPNKGINYPTLSIGINTSLNDDVTFPNLKRNHNHTVPDDIDRFCVSHFSGWSNAAVGDKEKFYVFGFAANYSRWIGRRSAISLGTEWIFDSSRREQIKLNNSNSAYAQGGLLIGHEFWLGRVTFSQQLGIYYFNEFRVNDDLYQRYGLLYHLKNHLFFGFNLKAHRHVADFFDLRIGYRF